MLIKNNELMKYISGAVYIEESSGVIPYRFTKEKVQSVQDDNSRLLRHKTGSGIKIDFWSDTEELSFNFKLHTKCIDNLYNHYFFDIYVDNSMILHQGDRNVDVGGTGKIYVSLKKVYKRITIYLPCSALVEISDFSLSDGAVINQVEYNKNVMFLGDSITHSAYIDFPSMSYSNILARKMNYNILNQAIGGDTFSKEHLTYMPNFIPDVIFVAFGTNDWASNHPDIPMHIEEYFSILRELYNDTDINVILPIWRKDMNNYPEYKYSFSDVRDMIKKTAEKYNANIIDGFDFVPSHELLWFDGYLHPNEGGFIFYADAIEKCLKM